MNRIHNPKTIAAPGGRYSHGVEVPPNARWLYVSGQVGVAPNGEVPAAIGPQVENCWRNILAILADAGMGLGDVVKVTVLLIRDSDISAYREARDRVIGDARPASTLMVISRLASPDYLVEIEAVAAKAT